MQHDAQFNHYLYEEDDMINATLSELIKKKIEQFRKSYCATSLQFINPPLEERYRKRFFRSELLYRTTISCIYLFFTYSLTETALHWWVQGSLPIIVKPDFKPNRYKCFPDTGHNILAFIAQEFNSNNNHSTFQGGPLPRDLEKLKTASPQIIGSIYHFPESVFRDVDLSCPIRVSAIQSAESSLITKYKDDELVDVWLEWMQQESEGGDCATVFVMTEMGSLRIHEYISIISLCYGFYLICYDDDENQCYSPTYNVNEITRDDDDWNWDAPKRSSEMSELREIMNYLYTDAVRKLTSSTVDHAVLKARLESSANKVHESSAADSEKSSTDSEVLHKYLMSSKDENKSKSQYLKFTGIFLQMLNFLIVLTTPILNLSTGVPSTPPNMDCDTDNGEIDLSWLTSLVQAKLSLFSTKSVDVWIWSNNTYNYLLLALVLHLSTDFSYSVIYLLSIFMMMISSSFFFFTLDTPERSFSWFAIQLSHLIFISGKYYTEYLERSMWFVMDTFRQVEQERRSLLQDMLPSGVLLHFERDCLQMSYQHDRITFLFSDIVGFTAWSKSKPAMEVVILLQSLFVSFDAYSIHYNVFKICTIGDAYVVTSQPNCRDFQVTDTRENMEISPEDIMGMMYIIQLAKAMRSRVAQVGNKLASSNEGVSLSMRIGLHHGCCVGGVIGSRRIRYDIWGPDVLVGNLMEQSADVGKVLVSDSFRKFYLKNQHEVVCRLFPRLSFGKPKSVLFEAANEWIPSYHIDMSNDWSVNHDKESK